MYSQRPKSELVFFGSSTFVPFSVGSIVGPKSVQKLNNYVRKPNDLFGFQTFKLFGTKNWLFVQKLNRIVWFLDSFVQKS